MITMPALDGCLAGLRARRASCSIFIPYPHIYPSNMPTPLPIMCFKLHRKHGDTWNSDRLTFTPSLVTHGSVSQLSIVPRLYSHGIMKHVQPGPGCCQSMQCCSVLQAAEVRNGKLWRAPLLPLASSPNPIIPSPLFLMLSALSFTRRKCICLRFLWICKIKTSWRRDAAQPGCTVPWSFELFKQTEEF